MKRKLFTLSALSVLMFATFSCVKVDLHNTPHPDKGAVVVDTKWSTIASVTVPATYSVRIQSESGSVLHDVACSKRSEVMPLLSPAVTHDIHAFNCPLSTSVSDGSLKVGKLSDGSLELMPDWFFSGSASVVPVADDTVHVDLPLKQHMYEIQFKLEVVEGNPERIASVDVSLSNVAWQCRFIPNYTVLNDAAEIKPVFTRNGKLLSSTIHVLGFVGTKQRLVMNILFTDRRAQTIDREYDFSSILDEYDPDSKPVLVFNAELNTPVEIDGNASITDWDVTEEYITIK